MIAELNIITDILKMIAELNIITDILKLIAELKVCKLPILFFMLTNEQLFC